MENKAHTWHTAIIIAGTVVIAALASSVLLLTVYADPGFHKDSAEGPVVISNKKVKAVPSSDLSRSQVSLRLTFDTGAVFTVTQFEGLPIRVEQNGSTIGIAAYIDTSNGNQVRADIFRGLPVNSADVTIKDRIPDISSFEIRREPSELAIGDLGTKLQVKLVGITYEDGPPIEGKEISQVHKLGTPGELGDGGQCCVICSGIRVCGCAVEGPCGSCCAGTCCT